MAQNKYGYVPPAVQANMTKHLQQSLPAHLKQYAGGNTYIPARAEKQIMQHMQKSMPGHLKQYASSYMHQQSTAGVAALHNHAMPSTPRVSKPTAPVPDRMRRDHSGFVEQFTVDTNNNASMSNPGTLSFSPQYQGNTDQPVAAATNQQPGSGDTPPSSNDPYEFIMNPPPPKRKMPLSGGSKPILTILGIAAMVVVALVVIFSLLSGGGKNSANFVSLAQQQQEIARVADLQFSSLKDQKTKDFAINTSLVMNSDKTALVDYVGAHGVKLSPKKIAAGMDATTDTKLETAQSTSSLDATLVKELQDELTSYQATLRQTYGATSGKETRALLAKFNSNADLLLTQSKQ